MNKINVIRKAYENKYAVPQFNIINAEYARYILEECEELKSPVILGVSEKVAAHLGGFNVARKIVDGIIEDCKITIPVILHLDHAKSKEACESAIKAGFDSVMIDYSSYNLEENIKVTKELVNENKDVIVECEVGSIGKNGNEGVMYAKAEDVIRMKEETNVQMIAAAFGTVHGVYKGKPCLNYDLLNNICKVIDTPLVMHGGSGLSEEEFKDSIKNGVAKININTELKQAWTHSVREYLDLNPEKFDPVFIIKSTEKEMKLVVKKLINIFGSENQA